VPLSVTGSPPSHKDFRINGKQVTDFRETNRHVDAMIVMAPNMEPITLSSKEGLATLITELNLSQRMRFFCMMKL